MDRPGASFEIFLTGEKGSMLMGDGFGETFRIGDLEDWRASRASVPSWSEQDAGRRAEFPSKAAI